jgi:A-factor type gamma-butyrolactone 1'-reductase (1S-forming)
MPTPARTHAAASRVYRTHIWGGIRLVICSFAGGFDTGAREGELVGVLDGKVAIVTGASSGIGEAAAVAMAVEGAGIVVAARREDRGEAVAARINAAGGQALFVRADVTDASQVAALVDRTVERFGRLDCAVNNAGIAGPVAVPVADVTEEQWDEVMAVNLRGVWLSMKYEIPAMLAAGAGSIVNVGSAYGHKPSPIGHAPYATTKHALVGLTKTAAIDYGTHGVRCNVVAPGFTTRRWSIHRCKRHPSSWPQ